MLKCTMCGHVEKCCHVLCPVCGERMVPIEDYGQVPPWTQEDSRVGDPLFPEDIRAQCKSCGRRTPLYLVTDYRVGDVLTLGICRECYFSVDR